MDKAYMDMAKALAIKGMEQIDAYFAYQGSDARYQQKARIGAVVVGTYSRLEGTKTNRMALKAAAKRIDISAVPVKQLSE